MAKFRIFQDSKGYHVQKEVMYSVASVQFKRDFLSLPPFQVSDWNTISTHKTLMEARKAKEKQEILSGRVVE